VNGALRGLALRGVPMKKSIENRTVISSDVTLLSRFPFASAVFFVFGCV
jgi:hypothetical protein